MKGLEEAHVSTIHGFCADLLRERPVEAGVDPLFEVLTESSSARLFDDAFGRWLQEQLANPPEGVRRALRRTSFGGDNGPIDRLRSAAWELAQWRDFKGQWMREGFVRHNGIHALVAALHDFATLTRDPGSRNDPLFTGTEPVRRLSDEIALQREFGDLDAEPDFDGWEAALVDLARDRMLATAKSGRGSWYRTGVARDVVLAARDAFRTRLDQFRLAADAELAALLQQELAGAIQRYEALKAKAGALDFLDLLLGARNLVRDNPSVRRGFQSRFKRIFVDEFQDTDPLQAEILLLLAADDPEETDWRRARPVAGRAVSGRRSEAVDLSVSPGRRGRLSRRLPSTRGAGRRRRTPDDQLPQRAGNPGLRERGVRTDSDGRRHDVAGAVRSSGAPSPRAAEPAGHRCVAGPRTVREAIHRRDGHREVASHAVGALVDWIVNSSKWMVTERSGVAPVPVAAKHVCLLFRRFISFRTDMTRPYVEALEARGIPHVLVGGRAFHEREEVEAIRAALAAIEWPDDELSVFATLRGPFFAIGDEELLEWAHRFGTFGPGGFRRQGFHPFRVPSIFGEDTPPDLEHLRPIATSLALLKRLHRRRNYVPVAETLHELLDATRAHVGFALRSGGEQALANVLHVAELARQYELDGGISFRGFVDELRAEAETAQAAEAPILEEDSDGVRMMTVHKAKGLEFPIVILADLTCKLSRAEAGRWIDAERGSAP